MLVIFRRVYALAVVMALIGKKRPVNFKQTAHVAIGDGSPAQTKIRQLWARTNPIKGGHISAIQLEERILNSFSLP